METANLPVEDAQVPAEEAYQSRKEKTTNKTITFDGNLVDDKPLSQISNGYKEILSQPSQCFSHVERLRWLQTRRTTGLWVQCDECNKWRYLPHVLDSYELPKNWFCKDNPDRSVANCSAPEMPIKIRDEEDMIHSEYSAGSVVWARLQGWPWWPAMVDDCPDTEQFYWLDGFSDIPTHYNVVFFDNDVTRAWITPENLKPFNLNLNKDMSKLLKNKKYKLRMELAMKQADDANCLPLNMRLNKYSFINRYRGKISLPVLKTQLVKRYEKKLKRKYNITFESDDEADMIIISEKGSKEPNSMAVLVGSPTLATDNTKQDSPNACIQADSTAELVNDIQASKNFEIRIDSPNSGDFDF